MFYFNSIMESIQKSQNINWHAASDGLWLDRILQLVAGKWLRISKIKSKSIFRKSQQAYLIHCFQSSHTYKNKTILKDFTVTVVEVYTIQKEIGERGGTVIPTKKLSPTVNRLRFHKMIKSILFKYYTKGSIWVVCLSVREYLIVRLNRCLCI